MRFSKNKLTLLLLAAAVLAALIAAFRPKPIPVDAAPASRGPLMVTVDEDGRTRIVEIYVVSSPLAGRLRRIELDPGDPVVAGETLVASIDPGDPSLLDPRARAQASAKVSAAEAALEQAEAHLERANAAYDRAGRELERKTVVWDKGFLSEGEFDEVRYAAAAAREDKRSAESALQIARFELAQARAALLHTRGDAPHGEEGDFRFEIPSPIDGRVLRIFQESSTVVVAGERLLELGDPRQLEVVVDVLSRHAVGIEPGARVLLEHWGGDEALEGRVRRVEPAAFTKISALGVEEQRVNVLVDFTEPPGKRPTLGDAYRVEARIVTWESAEVLKVPAGALFRNGAGAGWAAFVVENGRALLRELEAGHSNGIETEVLGGLEEGNQVILHPSDQITDGARITIR